MQFKPPEDVDLNQLLLSDEEAVHKALHKLAESVRVRHLPLFPPFEDYDKVHRGNVTTGQFKRVLDDLSLMPHLSQFELNLICLKFGVIIGGRHDINYNAFCLLVEDYAQTKWNEQ
uniref:EF-hand domain-containing protein n=1 Tax=Amphimedon queenslandica TaxID=400682 RepID=A0A1X7SU31_AMPQE